LGGVRDFALLQIIQTVSAAHPAFLFDGYRVKAAEACG
jgi:hypothetical protein